MAEYAQKVPPITRAAPLSSATPLAGLLVDLAAPVVTEAPQLPLAALDGVPGRSRLVVQLLHNRGITEPAAVEAFLAAEWHAPGPPLLHLDRAVERIRRALAEGERIVVYGDFDCDGITSCALLAVALRALGAQVDTYVPRRDDDGRGLNAEAVSELAASGARLIITTDSGTANVEETQLARSLGVDVIVTDHHPPHGPLAPACAILNPCQEGDSSGESDLSGAGVAFRLAEALLTNAPTETFERDEQRDLIDSLLELVAIGTIADVVPLTSGNWALVRAGLRRMNTAPRPGVRALLQGARVGAGNVVARDISFALAPRLNACGRMGQPELAVRILRTDDESEAASLAQAIETLNLERQVVTDRVMTEAREQAERQRTEHAALIVVGDGWPLGVIGLVAGRLADEYRRPAFVLSRDADEYRGSARAAAGANLGELLAARPDFFKRFGGHAQAAGFTLAAENLVDFEAYVRERLAARDISPQPESGASRTDGPRVVRADCRLHLHRLAVGSDVYADLAALEPYGPGFSEPIFLTPALRIVSCRRSGPDGRTLRLTLQDERGSKREAIWSRRGEFCERLRTLLPSLPPVDVAYTLRRYSSIPGASWLMHLETLAPTQPTGDV